MFVYKFFGKNHEFEVVEELNLIFYSICKELQIRGSKKLNSLFFIKLLSKVFYRVLYEQVNLGLK